MTYIPEQLRHLVYERAGGCREYCLIPEAGSFWAHEIDRIIPEKHRGETIEENLCLSCFDCNRYKGTDFGSFDPETGDIARLFNPLSILSPLKGVLPCSYCDSTLQSVLSSVCGSSRQKNIRRLDDNARYVQT